MIFTKKAKCPKCGNEFNALMLGNGRGHAEVLTPCCGVVAKDQSSVPDAAKRQLEAEKKKSNGFEMALSNV